MHLSSGSGFLFLIPASLSFRTVQEKTDESGLEIQMPQTYETAYCFLLPKLETSAAGKLCGPALQPFLRPAARDGVDEQAT